jgi:hypothetical protein
MPQSDTDAVGLEYRHRARTACVFETAYGWLCTSCTDAGFMHQRLCSDTLGIAKQLGSHKSRLHGVANANPNTLPSSANGFPAAFTNLCECNRWLGDRDWRVCDVLRVDLSHHGRRRDLD